MAGLKEDIATAKGERGMSTSDTDPTSPPHPTTTTPTASNDPDAIREDIERTREELAGDRRRPAGQARREGAGQGPRRPGEGPGHHRQRQAAPRGGRRRRRVPCCWSSASSGGAGARPAPPLSGSSSGPARPSAPAEGHPETAPAAARPCSRMTGVDLPHPVTGQPFPSPGAAGDRLARRPGPPGHPGRARRRRRASHWPPSADLGEVSAARLRLPCLRPAGRLARGRRAGQACVVRRGALLGPADRRLGLDDARRC